MRRHCPRTYGRMTARGFARRASSVESLLFTAHCAAGVLGGDVRVIEPFARTHASMPKASISLPRVCIPRHSIQPIWSITEKSPGQVVFCVPEVEAELASARALTGTRSSDGPALRSFAEAATSKTLAGIFSGFGSSRLWYLLIAVVWTGNMAHSGGSVATDGTVWVSREDLRVRNVCVCGSPHLARRSSLRHGITTSQGTTPGGRRHA